MRKSRLYNFYVNPENGSQNTNALAEKYQFKSQFGDQVWYYFDIIKLFFHIFNLISYNFSVYLLY